jgi:uncharacterized protein YkwD
MGLVSRILSRAGFGTGAIATTALLIGGFAIINGNVSLDTLFADGSQSAAQPTLADVPVLGATESASAPATPAPSSSPPPTTSTAPPATPAAPPGKRSPLTSRSVSARETIAKNSSADRTVVGRSNSTMAQQVLNQINAARRSAGLSPLSMNAGLVRSAATHNAVMASGCGLSHQCSGEADLGKRISAQGVTWTAAGENIGQGGPEPDSPNAIVAMAKQLTADMLAETPPNDGHRKNILSKNFKHVGIDLYRDSKGTVWMTQDFSS